MSEQDPATHPDPVTSWKKHLDGLPAILGTVVVVLEREL